MSSLSASVEHLATNNDTQVCHMFVFLNYIFVIVLHAFFNRMYVYELVYYTWKLVKEIAHAFTN